MYTPPVKPAITPKINQDLPCSANPSGPQPSKPAPIYQPPAAKAPAPAPAPVHYASAPTVAPTPYNPAPTVASLQNDLSQATLTISKASLALGYPGKASGFLAFAQALAVELKTLRAKK